MAGDVTTSYRWDCDAPSCHGGYSITERGAEDAASTHRRDCDGSTTVRPVS